jgi:pimeloyl-ACP methyl ester carboxylesterase
MNRLLALALATALALSAAPPVTNAAPAPQAALAASCQDSPLPSGAKARVCLPAAWSDLLLYVPGFSTTAGFRNLELPDGTSLPDVVNGLGLAFATTDVGLTGDVRELLDALPTLAGRAPSRIILAGASRGGLVATLLAEQQPNRFAGLLALCAPIGDFRSQVDYFGDFRVVFDALFPGVLPPSPIQIPQQLIDGWQTTYAPAVTAQLQTSPALAADLIAATNAPVDRSTPQTLATTTLSTTLGVLWYNVFATNGTRAQLGGNPYSNQGRVYAAANGQPIPGVARFDADPQALAAGAAEETSGRIWPPMVILHTTGDEIVPVWHAERYRVKAERAGFASRVSVQIVERYGHCTFRSDEVLLAFFTLNQQITDRGRVFFPLTVR